MFHPKKVWFDLRHFCQLEQYFFKQGVDLKCRKPNYFVKLIDELANRWKILFCFQNKCNFFNIILNKVKEQWSSSQDGGHTSKMLWLQIPIRYIRWNVCNLKNGTHQRHIYKKTHWTNWMWLTISVIVAPVFCSRRVTLHHFFWRRKPNPKIETVFVLQIRSSEARGRKVMAVV